MQVQTPIDPRRMSFSQWADSMRVQNRDLPESSVPWVLWGQQAQQYEPDWPDPRRFRAWQDYASACIATV